MTIEAPPPEHASARGAEAAPGADTTAAAAPAPSSTPPPEDVGAALRFVHLLEMQTKARMSELSASFNALLETLVSEGSVPLEAYEKRKRLTMLRESSRAEGDFGVELSDIPDKYTLGALPDVDCDALLPLCKARCCSLGFALSVQDLDERVVRWSYAAPYRIAQKPDGSCVHNEEGRCGVYEHRPGICRAYDCRKDRRIWADFERRIPAP